MKPKPPTRQSGFRCSQMRSRNRNRMTAKKLQQAVKQSTAWTVTPVEGTTLRLADKVVKQHKESNGSVLRHGSPTVGREGFERHDSEQCSNDDDDDSDTNEPYRPPFVVANEFAFVHEGNRDNDSQRSVGPLSLAALKKRGKLTEETSRTPSESMSESSEDSQDSVPEGPNAESDISADEAEATPQYQSDSSRDWEEYNSRESGSSSCEEETLPHGYTDVMESSLWHNTSADNSAYSVDNESGGEQCSEPDSQPTAFTSTYRLFSLQNKLQVALVRPPTILRLRGRAVLRVLYGTVDVAGYVLTPDNPLNKEGVLVQGGLLSSAVKISPLPSQSDSTVSKLVQELQQLDLSSWDSVSPHFNADTAVVLLKKAEGRWPAVELVVEGLTQLPEMNGGCAGLGFYVNPAEDVDKHMWGKQLPGLATTLVKAATSLEQETSCVLVCGPKNSGKSTLLRMLVNCLLNVCPEVMYLDCDPGQTEFSPPGTVSLNKVTLPLLGPPFTHVHMSEKMYFLGDVTPAAYPESYSKAVLSLVEYKQQHYANVPLFVNTMGWVSGIGLSLLVDVIRWVAPTNVVQLVPPPPNTPLSGAGDMPIMDASTVQLACGWFSSRKGSPAETAVDNGYTLHQFNAVSRRPSSRAALMRQAMLLSYLSQGHHSSAFCPWGVTPYRVPWSAVAIHECSGSVQKRDLLLVLNASLVALCTVPKEKLLETEVPEYPMFLRENPPYECVGYGIVRAIDPEEKVFYILTPESKYRLSKVNALIKGGVNIPEVLLKRPARFLKKGQRFPYIARGVSKLPSTEEPAENSDSESSSESDKSS